MGLLKNLFIIVVCALITIGICIAVYQLLIIPSSGTVALEYGLTATPTSIDWETVNLNEEISKTVTLTNTGTKDISLLNMTHILTSGDITYTLTWTCEDFSLPVDDKIDATFILTITSGTSGEAFSIDITINDKA